MFGEPGSERSSHFSTLALYLLIAVRTLQPVVLIVLTDFAMPACNIPLRVGQYPLEDVYPKDTPSHSYPDLQRVRQTVMC